MVDRVADLLAPRFPDGTTQDMLRSEAFGWLARPADLLTGGTGDTGEAGAAARPRVVLYIHLHEAAVRTDHDLARIEDIGPVLSSEIPAWLDHDHVDPYVPGRTGQTGDHNTQPLGPTGHRVKTHAPGYTVRQLGPGDYVWHTPHHRYRRVNHLGNTLLTEPIGSGFMSDDPVDRTVAQMTLDLAATGRARVPVF